MHLSMGRMLGILVALLALTVSAAKSKDRPQVEETQFEAPANLFYFEDSDVVLVTDVKSKTAYRSEDAGVHWTVLEDVEKGEVLEVVKHPFDNQIAIVLGYEKRHWITRDQGKSFKSFKTPQPARPPISFHASDPERLMIRTAECADCKKSMYYTTDGFDTEPKLLLDDAMSCLWAKSTDLIQADEDDILCIVKGSFSSWSSDYRLLASSDFFKTDGVEPMMTEDGRSVSGIMNLASVKSYIVAAAKSENTLELAMYVTDDAKTWHRAEFGEHRLEENAYTLLESTNYSMQVDVLATKPTAPIGALLTSNSNGTFFTKTIEHTNRNMHGFVDFEKIQNIQGIVLVNVVDNWEEVESSWFAEKKLTSQISFDDGRTWQSLKADDKTLHLHSVTDQSNMGRIFSSPAPGIVMGVGNTGKYLKEYAKGDLYVSDDAGLTWTKALSEPHLYEFGDQGAILVAIKDEETTEVKWSLNHGKDWKSTDLRDMGIKGKIRPIGLTTTPDSTSLKFLLTAIKGKSSNREHFIYSLDFEGLHEDKCKKSDFEDWYARVDEDGEPTCIMGHTQMFRRRKADAECFVDEEFKDPMPVMEDCKCKAEDFECDYENNFTWDAKNKKCVGSGSVKAPSGACEDGEKTFVGSSGYRLIPGNTCTKKGGETLDEPVEHECGNSSGVARPSGKVGVELTKFKGDKFTEYYYLERCPECRGDDETVIMRTDEKVAWISRDHGFHWSKVDTDGEDVVAIYPHQYLNDAVYLVTPSKTVYYSQNRGDKWHSFTAPEKPNQDRLQILQFHPTQKDWLIWTGSTGDQTVAHVSQKGGDDWDRLLRSVRKCQFVYREGRADSDQLIFCEQYASEDPSAPISLMSSDDFFKRKKELKRDVINFATMAEYIVVAIRDEDQESLRVDTSIDGQVFADARFPSNFKVAHQQAYTVLDSSTHAVFLHVTVNNKLDAEYGSIVKSNSNGTSYVLSVGEVNRNSPGYVDFEKMQGLEGVAIVNRVANPKDADNGKEKKLKTYITHNDGADWALLPKPAKNLKGKGYKCKGGIEKCSLHLHGYTERKDPRDTFSSPSAVGLMIATGNVGEYLRPKKEADTFATRDGGVTWLPIAEGNWMWEFGDQGSILVIVKEDEATDSVRYSLNEGRDWEDYKFIDSSMQVEDISTVPSDTSRKFLLWGKMKGGLVSISLDFSGLEERSERCDSPDRPGSDGISEDYDLWEPKHPLSNDNCLFGHVAQYHRKKLDAKCYNGREIQHLHSVARNCTCTRRDFECDYNYEKQSDGSCRLVPGLSPPDPKDQCKAEGVDEYFDITGYRRIPLTTCQGGQELDYTSRVSPCPGKEPEFEKKHGIGGAGLFFAVVIPIAAAAGIGYWVWKNWDGKFGRIQLGDAPAGAIGGIGGSGAFDRDAPWIKYPIMALSGIVAVVAALPMVAGSLWRTVSTRLGRNRAEGGGGYSGPYTSRNSFARGRGDYAVVDPDEGELLGEADSDEEV
ncbi:hypothetical protein B0A50_01891 [Salinomyces thailandicus]|uniref:Vacuolar protein sorting/targeting protein 10 n=1 Tax=Salinomyces thailandicus TaxID=706561 RepID=A0A4U0UAS2_9PEZI|nr:hypothetical protein B0A50_01891 [Salinomyces thailandica]